MDKHYFATCAFGWAVATTETEAVLKVWRAFKNQIPRKPLYIGVATVPGPVDRTYSISNYSPQVEGVEWLWTGDFYMDSKGGVTVKLENRKEEASEH